MTEPESPPAGRSIAWVQLVDAVKEHIYQALDDGVSPSDIHAAMNYVWEKADLAVRVRELTRDQVDAMIINPPDDPVENAAWKARFNAYVTAREEAFRRGVRGRVEVPAYGVTTEPDGGFRVVMPDGLTGVQESLIAGDVRRRFESWTDPDGPDPFDGIRVPYPHPAELAVEEEL